jgi:peptidoglycan hydrolase CwlO-like protein
MLVLNFIAEPAAAGPPGAGRSTGRTMVGRALAAVVVLFVLPAGTIALARPAHADSIDSVESSITSLETKVTAQSSQIHQLTSAYQAASVQSGTLTQQIQAVKSSLGGLHAAVNTSQSDLRQVAIRAYTSGGASAVGEKPNTNPAVGDEYLDVASGDVSDTVDQLKTERGQLGAAEANLTQEQKADVAAVAAAGKARSQALAVATAEQSQLDTLQSKLEQLQDAAAASAKAQAVAAATEAASQGAPVNNGLVSTVQAEVSPPTTSSPTTDPDTEPSASTAATPDLSAVPYIEVPETTTTVEASPDTTTTTTTDPSTTTSTTTPVTVTEAPVVAAPASPVASGSTPADFAALAQCESSGNYSENTGNGFYGAYQFSQATWTGLGFPGEPDQEPAAMQDEAAEELEARSGWAQWPACSAALGL